MQRRGANEKNIKTKDKESKQKYQELVKIIEEELSAAGIEIVDIEYRREAGRMVFRVFIDHADGVDLDLCEKASRMISGILDREDPIPQAYTLEVSSPGLDRVLKKDRDFERFSGHKVKLKTFEAIDGQKKFTGTLVGLIDGKIILETEEKRVSIPRESTTQVRLVVDL